MWLGRLVGRLCLTLPICLLLALAAILVRKLWFFQIDARVWSVAWIGGAALVGVTSGVVWTWLTRRSLLDAAVEIDRRCGLKERLSSAVALDEQTQQTAAGRALVSDAIRRVERLDVGEHFRMQASRRLLWPLGAAVVLVAVALLAPDAAAPPPTAASSLSAKQQREVRTTARTLREELSPLQQKARQLGSAELDRLMERVDRDLKELADKQHVEPRRVIGRISRREKELRDARDKLDAEKIRHQLSRLRLVNRGPAQRMTRALKEGDFNKARRELDRLTQELKDGRLTEEDQRKIADQLSAMQQKAQKQAEQHRQSKRDLQEQIKRAKQAGDKAKAEQLKRQLRRMEERDSAVRRLEQMAGKLGSAAESLKQGQPAKASQQLEDLDRQLADLQQQDDQMEVLNQTLDKVGRCKRCLQGGQPTPGGSQAKSGSGSTDRSSAQRGQQRGDGLGEGRGAGRRPLAEGDAGFTDSQVGAKPRGGAGVVTGEIDGPNLPGKTRLKIAKELEAARRDQSDPLSGQRLPRGQRGVVREYFDAFRKGGGQ